MNMIRDDGIGLMLQLARTNPIGFKTQLDGAAERKVEVPIDYHSLIKLPHESILLYLDYVNTSNDNGSSIFHSMPHYTLLLAIPMVECLTSSTIVSNFLILYNRGTICRLKGGTRQSTRDRLTSLSSWNYR